VNPEGLSGQQERFLVRLLKVYRDLEAPGRLTEQGSRELPIWGVRSGHLRDGAPRSESASVSRMLRRLEDRRLIERRNQSAGDRYSPEIDRPELKGRVQHRTTHVKLTPKGRELAEWLTERI
jgi:hypothetical protein